MTAGLFFLLLAATLSGCGLLSEARLSPMPTAPARTLVPGVPFFPQEELQCGPASLAMALAWSGVSVPPADLVPEVFSPGLKGSLQSSMVGAARRHGRLAYSFAGPDVLLAEIGAGHPAIVLVNLGFFWYPKWHYAVAIGYDQERSEIILHSGLTANERLSFRVFMNIWKRSGFWGLLVLPPDRLPARVTEGAWLDAVLGLERAGQLQAAATGYAAAVERWPQSFSAWMSLGNSRYSQSDLAGAAEAFRRAILLKPENGMAFNNLAHVLAEQGKQQEALSAAQRAVDLGGPLLERFRQTLEEVRSTRGP